MKTFGTFLSLFILIVLIGFIPFTMIKFKGGEITDIADLELTLVIIGIGIIGAIFRLTD